MATRFLVKCKQPEFIVPAEATPRELKQLSDIDDQRGLRFHFPMIMFYQNNPLMEGKDPVGVISEAIAKILVHYYPYAGRLIEGPNDKLIVDCNSEGVMFVEADADVRLEQLGDAIFPPCPFGKELMHDMFQLQGMVGCPLMLIQVTRFICGGFALAVCINHVISDASGLIQFLHAAAEIARGAPAPFVTPVWSRHLLTARTVPPRKTYIHHEYENNNNNNNNNNGHNFNISAPSMDHDNLLLRRPFFFGPKEISNLQKNILQPQHRNSSSKFDLITACVWRSRTIALQLHPDEDVRLSCMVSLRGKDYLNLPDGYYGNAVVTPAAISKAKLLCENPLGYALELLKKAKDQVLNEDYIRSVMHVMATRGRPPFSTSWNFTVSDASRIGFGDVDFGWGKAIYGGTMDGGTSTNSIYASIKNSRGEHGILVPIRLPKAAMERFEEEVRKLTQGSTHHDSKGLKTVKIASAPLEYSNILCNL